MKFEVDDWSAKVEYLEQWDVIPEGGDRGPAVYIEYGVSPDIYLVGICTMISSCDLLVPRPPPAFSIA